MIKKHKYKLIFSSLLILLPVILGLLFWRPITEHSAFLDTVGGRGGLRSFALVGLGFSLFFLALHWVCVLFSLWDNKRNNQSEKILHLTFWICPTISLFTGGLTLAISLGWKINMQAIIGLLFGILMIIIGNYMPKCRRNHTVGIKIYWTLSSEENWNATHRLGGKIMVATGFLMFPAIFLPLVPFFIVFTALVLLMILVPTLYSYRYYKRQLAEGETEKIDYRPQKQTKIALIVSAAILVPILVFCGIVTLSGNFEVQLDDTSLSVVADFYGDLDLNYADITAVEYVENDAPAYRTYGFGSPRLSMGVFESDTLGNHTRYTYEGCDAAVVLTVKSGKLVLNRKTPEETLALYRTLLEKTGK
ncbi:MAG: SdpI family protein [Clostridia bacterium]|nr:SdpI family protein [Clostridia bacterium]